MGENLHPCVTSLSTLNKATKSSYDLPSTPQRYFFFNRAFMGMVSYSTSAKNIVKRQSFRHDFFTTSKSRLKERNLLSNLHMSINPTDNNTI
ncbi:hypothetical protein AYI70_g10645 [Smittium culicis]|uniref:Uncharacterized protein n=1 Tax=Smittium culicis TaxID=133412 RepID=A0A1R1X5L1_9FUNG|nr:hypothetical protein AYI70_g10645 [Smittium culicis]